MVESTPGAVNRVGLPGSTIGGLLRDGVAARGSAGGGSAAPSASALAAWLAARSAHLPRRFGLSMRWMPPRCLFCGQAGDLGKVDLCSDCLEALPPAIEDTRAGEICATNETKNDKGPVIGIESMLVPFRYAPPVDAALRALKFQGDLAPAQVFGALIAAVAACRGEVPDLLVPVPLHPDRLHERGFNQAARIARSAGLWLGRPCAPWLLERQRPTLPQTSLEGPARRANLAGAFALAAASRGDSGGRGAAVPPHVALVDDVLTTGATMAAAIEALQGAAGLQRVSCWAVARPVSGFLTPLADLAGAP